MNIYYIRWHHPYGRKWKGTQKPLDESESGEWKVGLKLNIQKTKIMASVPITSWKIDRETMETVTDFILGVSKITSDGDCSHEIKRHLLLGKNESESCSVMSYSLRPCGLNSPWNSLGQNTGVGSLSLLHGIFPTQGSNLSLPHCRRFFTSWAMRGTLGRKAMTSLDSILKSRDITLPTKVHIVKAMVFPVVMYGCESWNIKKAEHWKIDAFELWYWRRLLRSLLGWVPWMQRDQTSQS